MGPFKGNLFSAFGWINRNYVGVVIGSPQAVGILW